MVEENKRRAFSKSIWVMLKKTNTSWTNQQKQEAIERLKIMKCCVYCGSFDNLAVDHIFSLKLYNNNQPENLVISCKSCNSSKHDKDVILWAKEKGIILPKFILNYIPQYKRELNGQNTI